jgi:hypothetical protein
MDGHAPRRFYPFLECLDSIAMEIGTMNGGEVDCQFFLDLTPRLQTGRGFSRFFVHGLTP